MKQPCPQGLLGVLNGGLERTLANSRSCDHKLANHKARYQFETIINLQFFWRHATFCLPGSSPSRHLEHREDPGDEVANERTLVAIAMCLEVDGREWHSRAQSQLGTICMAK